MDEMCRQKGKEEKMEEEIEEKMEEKMKQEMVQEVKQAKARLEALRARASQSQEPLSPDELLWQSKLCFKMFQMFYHGIETKVDYAEAMNWLKESAEGGYPSAQHLLGEFYCWGGRALQRDWKTGVAWITKAADQGCEEALTALGDYAVMGYGPNGDNDPPEPEPERALELYRAAGLEEDDRRVQKAKRLLKKV